MTHETSEKSDAQTNNNTGQRSIDAADFASAYQLLDDPDHDLMLRGDSTREWIKTDHSVGVRR